MPRSYKKTRESDLKIAFKQLEPIYSLLFENLNQHKDYLPLIKNNLLFIRAIIMGLSVLEQDNKLTEGLRQFILQHANTSDPYSASEIILRLLNLRAHGLLEEFEKLSTRFPEKADKILLDMHELISRGQPELVQELLTVNQADYDPTPFIEGFAILARENFFPVLAEEKTHGFYPFEAKKLFEQDPERAPDIARWLVAHKDSTDLTKYTLKEILSTEEKKEVSIHTTNLFSKRSKESQEPSPEPSPHPSSPDNSTHHHHAKKRKK